MGVDLLTATSPLLSDAMTMFLEAYQDKGDLSSSFRSGEVGSMSVRLLEFISQSCDDSAVSPPEELIRALRCIRLLTRARRELESLIDERFLTHLMDLALSSDDFSSDSLTNESLRIIINLCIIHQDKVIPILHRRRLHLPILSLVSRIPWSSSSSEVLFAASRLLFYLSIDDMIQSDLRDHLNAVEIITNRVIEPVQGGALSLSTTSPIMYQSLSELLHVLFSLGSNTTSQRDCQKEWEAVAPSLLRLLMGNGGNLMSLSHEELIVLPRSPHYALMQDVVHLLFCFDSTALRPFTEAEAMRRILTLLEIQSRYNCANVESSVVPLLTVLERMCAADPATASLAKEYVFGSQFAHNTTLQYEFESGDTTLSSSPDRDSAKGDIPPPLYKILRQLITTFSPNVKHAVSSFLFATCDRVPAEYIRLVGFGNAVGLLSALNTPGYQIQPQQQ